MSSYLLAVLIAAVALAVLTVALLRAGLAAREASGLADRYQRELTSQVEKLRHRVTALRRELAGRRGRARTMR